MAAAPYAFIETLRERMFKPSLSTIITENSKYGYHYISLDYLGWYQTICLYLSLALTYVCRVAVVSPSDPVYVATKRMRELRVNSVIIVTGGQPQGILTYVLCIEHIMILLSVCSVF